MSSSSDYNDDKSSDNVFGGNINAIENGIDANPKIL